MSILYFKRKCLARIFFFALLTLFAGACNSFKTGKHSNNFLQNVIVVIGDDHTTKALGCYGNSMIRTPNLDRLASEGILFTNAYSNAPLCSASRQSILTGKYPHSTGVTLLQSPFKDDENKTIAEILRENGFKTGIVGKTHFNNYMDSIPPDHGFDYNWTHYDYKMWFAEHGTPVPDTIPIRPEWKPFQDPARIWLNADMLPGGFYEREGTANVYAEKAIEFIKRHKNERFCLWVGFEQPHSPFDFPVDYHSKYQSEDMQVPDGSPEDDRWIPAVFRDLSAQDKKGIIASYYTSVEYLDNNVGKILNAVNKMGLAGETLIIYIGDQGYLLGDHKRFEKHTMWEHSIKAPLIIKTGNSTGKNKVTGIITEFIDLAPTILEALGFELHNEMQGKSLLPVLQEKSVKHKDYVFAEFLCDNKAMVATEEWKYIFTSGKQDLGQGYATGFGPSGIVHRLYNLKMDPEETTNIVAYTENSEILSKLQEKMIGIFKQTHPFADSLPQGLSQEEILAWFCDPPETRYGGTPDPTKR